MSVKAADGVCCGLCASVSAAAAAASAQVRSVAVASATDVEAASSAASGVLTPAPVFCQNGDRTVEA